MHKILNTLFAILELMAIFVLVGLFFALIWRMNP